MCWDSYIVPPILRRYLTEEINCATQPDIWALHHQDITVMFWQLFCEICHSFGEILRDLTKLLTSRASFFGVIRGQSGNLQQPSGMLRKKENFIFTYWWVLNVRRLMGDDFKCLLHLEEVPNEDMMQILWTFFAFRVHPHIREAVRKIAFGSHEINQDFLCMCACVPEWMSKCSPFYVTLPVPHPNPHTPSLRYTSPCTLCTQPVTSHQVHCTQTPRRAHLWSYNTLLWFN